MRVAGEAARCGLDGALLRRIECPSCQGEVGPKDGFCGHCRCDLRQSPARWRPLQLKTAPLWRRFGAAVFDFLASLLALQGILYALTGWQQVGAALLLLPVAVSVLEAQGVCTPGQQIFGLIRLRPDGQPLRWRDWARVLWESVRPWRAEPCHSRLYWVPR